MMLSRRLMQMLNGILCRLVQLNAGDACANSLRAKTLAIEPCQKQSLIKN